jgi:TolB-like protein/Tfp pilus assembly protein PilF
MLTDLVGFTSMAQSNEALTMEILDEHKQRVRPILQRYGGREIKTMGDSFLVEFPNALDAVRCAVEIQEENRKVNSGRTPERRVMIRIGIHVGDVIHNKGDIFGDAVNIASRIEPLANPGGVCISEQVYDQVWNKVDFRLVKMESRKFKNVSIPTDVYSVEMLREEKAVAETFEVDRLRVAVLPLSNMSPDPNDEYFADGMTEELISSISNISGLSVISRTSVMQYKKPGKKLADIGKDLQVGTILEGSVRKFGNKVRVAIQLIDVREDKHLWAQNYDRELEDMFAIQSDIAERVAKALEVKVLGEEKHRLEGRASKNTEALTLYMKGRSSFDEGTEPRVRRAIEYFERAVQQDSDFALAYVGLADCYYWLEGDYMSHSEGIAKAKENLDKALALNTNLGEAHALLGISLRNELRWEEAEVEFTKALALSPSSAPAHHGYAGLLASVGKLDEALSEARKAQELDPLSLRLMITIGQVLYYQREYDQAIEQWKHVLRIEPNHIDTLHWLAFAYVRKSMPEEALRMFLKWKEQVADSAASPVYVRGFAKAALALVYANTGRIEEAKAMFKEAEEADPELTPVMGAWLHAILGNIDLAFEYLEKACRARDFYLCDIKVDPLWDPLRSDRRFAILLQNLRLV